MRSFCSSTGIPAAVFPFLHCSMAILMSGMLPERREAIWARAAEYQESRIVGGMHYPNDLDGGRRAGIAMAAVMLNDPAIRADYEAAKVELRKALGL